jgi:hypothetical protein
MTPSVMANCVALVQWCRHCARHHHAGGWETREGEKK